MNSTNMGACFFLDSLASTVKSLTNGRPAACTDGIQLAAMTLENKNKNVNFILWFRSDK